eukprot:scaffold359659_cov29-Prasinocladus_malaysianus.AAC.1
MEWSPCNDRHVCGHQDPSHPVRWQWRRRDSSVVIQTCKHRVTSNAIGRLPMPYNISSTVDAFAVRRS